MADWATEDWEVYMQKALLHGRGVSVGMEEDSRRMKEQAIGTGLPFCRCP